MAKVRKAVITAAGRGTRQYPATNTLQKELFPLVDVDGYAKPTIQIIAEEAFASGIEEVCIIANPTNLQAMKDHFHGLTDAQKKQNASKQWLLALSDKLDEMKDRISFAVQEVQDGYGHAVYQAKDFVGDEPFVLMLGDHVYIAPEKRCTRQVLDVFERYNAPVSSLVILGDDMVERNGIIGAEAIPGDPTAFKLTKMIEKPTLEYARREYPNEGGLPDGQYWGFFGIQAMPPAIFDSIGYLIENDIRVKNEIQFTSGMEHLLKNVDLYVGCVVTGERYDMGVPEGYIETQTALGLHSPYASHVYAALDAYKAHKSSDFQA